MILPDVKYADRIKKTTQTKFGGLNRGSATDGDIVDMQNMSSDCAPLLSSRKARALFKHLKAGGGLFSWEQLCWADGEDFVFNGKVKGKVKTGRKYFCAIGSSIIILPDKKIYNVDLDEFKSLEASASAQHAVFGDGKLFEEPASANALTMPDCDLTGFKTGDGVTISGCVTHPENNKTVIIRAIEGQTLYFYEETFKLPDEETEYEEEGIVTVERRCPDLKFMCEQDNRLWGCSDGVIYCSKLGDPYNWFVNDGLDSDSYQLEPGSAGNFTACVSYGGYPIFFKEYHVYKVYGSSPSSYQVLGSATTGVMQGCENSLAIVNEMLFYISPNGVMTYSGGIPQPIGVELGTERMKNAVSGTDGYKYYVSAQLADGDYSLLVFDTRHKQWHAEDSSQAIAFSRLAGNLYMLDVTGDIWIIGGEQSDLPAGTVKEAPPAWMVKFADAVGKDPNQKGVGKLQIRVELDEGAQMEAFLEFDSDGKWHRVGGIMKESPKRSHYLSVVPRRCDHYALKLAGVGGCRIYSITSESYSGSEFVWRN